MRIPGIIIVLLALTTWASSLVKAEEQKPAGVLEVLYSSTEHSAFGELLLMSSLRDQLAGTGPWTIFAPANSAFQEISEEERENLRSNSLLRDSLLRHHVIQGRVTAEELLRAPSVRALDGHEVPLRVVEGTLQIGGAGLRDSNIAGRNGLIHSIDKILSKGRSEEIRNAKPTIPPGRKRKT